MGDALISVIVASYRRDDTLLRALRSLGAQTYPRLEIVVVDDNGDPSWNEKTAAIVKSFEEQSGKQVVLIVNDHNCGSAESRNVGIRAASGEYIAFLDDDDEYLPQHLENQYRAMADANADYSLSDLMLLRDDGKLCEMRTRGYLLTDEGKNRLVCHLKYHMTGTDVMMFRKAYLMQIGMFDPINVGDEFYLMTKAIVGNGKFLYIPWCGARAYVHTGDGGLSSGEQKIRGENDLYTYKQQYFSDMTARDIRYIRMRHHAVLAFAYMRSGKTGQFLTQCLKGLLCAPMSGMRLVFERIVFRREYA